MFSKLLNIRSLIKKNIEKHIKDIYITHIDRSHKGNKYITLFS